MSLHQTLFEHDANPPGSWQVVRHGARSWALAQANGTILDSGFPTRREALEHRTRGFLVNLWEDEGRWMRGADVRGWKPYAVVVAERERNEAWQAERRAARAAAAS